ncbi:uncharacterized protein LOC119742605 isoform X1 [Patiria miniata]|uniref:Uncharacterized protein n=1 Tax=Patiria miniata TaxID=46514 RepID=A0A914BGU1_PATMI|nr:uncharacterized protein LOC119742605 isoform X1 [Patiria miniata]XP_038074648.1 uncharacterized protein LOC119742605 isoform X1 [Patiria miniata]
MAGCKVDPKRVMMVAGVTQIVLGVLGPIFWGLSWLYEDVDFSASPLWGGLVFFIPAGSMTVFAAIKECKSKAKIAALMCITACMTAIGVIVSTSLASAKDNQRPSPETGDLVINGFLIAIGCTELSASIISGSQAVVFVRQS